MPKLSHYGKQGEVRMVNVSEKAVTTRTALAQGFVKMKPRVEERSTVTTAAQTGVEMEALVAVAAAALTVYDMCKALDKGMEITDVVLVEKTGGKSGDYHRKAAGLRRGK